MYKIVVLDSDKKGKEILKKEFEAFKDVVITADFDTTQKTVEYLKNNEVDLVLLDLILPGEDGFVFLEKIKELDHTPKTIVMSSLSLDGFVQKALAMGASNFLLKPCQGRMLRERILEVLENRQKPVSTVSVKNKQLEEKITNIFITVGIPAHIKGYQFLREAIKLAIANPEIINSITKKLYPSIAERFETSASKVERAIRHAIEVAWNRGKIENINQLFGITVYSNNEKPTNGEFIALVADKMLIEGA